MTRKRVDAEGAHPDPGSGVRAALGERTADRGATKASLKLVGSTPRRPPSPPAEDDDDSLPVIRLGLDIARVVDETQTLLGQDPLVYQRPHELVSIARTERYAKHCPIEPGTPLVRPLSAAGLLTRLSLRCRYEREVPPDKREVQRSESKGYPPPEPDWKLCQPTKDVLASTLVAENWPDVRPLVGISEAPFLRLDGSICQRRGYDTRSGYLYLPGTDFPTILEAPRAPDAAQAMGALERVFQDFPHVNRASRMVPIAALLTLLARPAIAGSVPGFGLDSTTRGSGKTLQADVVAMIATGRPASRAQFPSDGKGKVNDVELEKILSAYALAGAPLILLDNVDVPISGASLDRCITARDEVSLRVLGRTEMRSLPWRAVMMASGNNLTFGQDTLRRFLRSRLQSPLERPEERTDFQIPNLIEYCRERRAELVTHALTILRAYIVAGKPRLGIKEWGSFESWAALIPGALLFAGGVDVMAAKPGDELATMGDLDALEIVLQSWPRLEREIGALITIRRLLAHVYPAPRHDEPPDNWDDLRDAIESAVPTRHGAVPSARLLGERFSRWLGRVKGDRKLARAGESMGYSTWRVVDATSDADGISEPRTS